MAHKNYRAASERKPSTDRRSSDDVRSLDSWSELTENESRNSYGENKQSKINSELMLNPSKLCAIKEPPEPKVCKVKLQKTDPDEYSSRSSKYFRDVPNQNDESDRPLVENPLYEYLKHRQHKGKERRKSSDSIESHTDDCDSSPATKLKFSSLPHDRSKRDLCGCNNCLETKRNGYSHHYRHNNSSPLYLKEQARPSHGNFISNSRNQKWVLDGSEVEQSEKVKNKIMSVWNNVKYGWTLKTKTNFGKDSPIFLLGSCYHKRPDDDDAEPGVVVATSHCLEQFKQDFQSRLWFTYRRDFQALPFTKFTTDCGWGCMLRSSQMMLAEAFITHFLGRDWRVHSQTKEQETFYRHIIQWFGDSLSDQCPFSVHRLAEIGKVFGKQPGEWYGPSSVAYILRDALSKASLSQPVLKDLCVYVAQDCTVYKQDVIELCTARPRNLTSSGEVSTQYETQSNSSDPSTSSDTDDQASWRSVIILIPVRLGGEEYNPIYSNCIKNLMAQEYCVGLIGGKPKHSLYFIGWQEDKLIYLDPHFCQDFVDTLKRDFKIESYHCFSPRKVSLTKMDPSATIGIYCRTRQDFNKFVDHTEQMINSNGSVYPMFVIQDGKGADLDIHNLSLSSERSLRIRHVAVDKNGQVKSSIVDSEEFVVL